MSLLDVAIMEKHGRSYEYSERYNYSSLHHTPSYVINIELLRHCIVGLSFSDAVRHVNSIEDETTDLQIY